MLIRQVSWPLRRPRILACQSSASQVLPGISSSVLRRALATVAKRYDAVVVGAGPGGLTCVSNLLDLGLQRICMVDPSFTSGRIHENYREVPSNTKAAMFTAWASGTDAFKSVIKSSPDGNPFQKVANFDQDQTCMLGDAIDVAQFLSDGLRKDKRVDSITKRVETLQRKDDAWVLPELGLTADRVVLATGSHPKPHSMIKDYPHLKELDLDTCLKPSLLKQRLPSGSKIGVIGASHSAILALKNLHDFNYDIVNFYRSPLLYAIYKDGWILYDNTGLKGLAATWAKETLDSGVAAIPPNIKRINLKDKVDKGPESEKAIYDRELADCTHLLSAIGFEQNALPSIIFDGRPVSPTFDALTGTFFMKPSDNSAQGGKYSSGGTVLDGLFGAGIAFPERVTDRVGNIEYAVGWFKFMKFVKRVAPDWVKQGQQH